MAHKAEVHRILTELNQGKIAVTQAEEQIMNLFDPWDALFEVEPKLVEFFEMEVDDFNQLVEKAYGGSFEFEAIQEADRSLYEFTASPKDAEVTMDFGECAKIRSGNYPMYCTHHVFKCLFEDGHLKAGKYLIDNR